MNFFFKALINEFPHSSIIQPAGKELYSLPLRSLEGNIYVPQ